MQQGQPDVMPEEVWTAIRNMGRAVEKLGDWPLPEIAGLDRSILLVLWRWTDFVEVLEAWTGPNDVLGVERWADDDALDVNDDVERWLVGLSKGAIDPETLRTRIASDTARTEALTAVLKWSEAHPDTATNEPKGDDAC